MQKGLCFSLVLLTFLWGCDHSLRFDDSVPEDARKEMLLDLNFVNAIQGTQASPFHKKIFGSYVSGQAYTDYFAKRIHRIGTHECGGAMACVMGFFDQNKMWVSEDYISYDVPQVLRVASLLHEARHTESKNDFWLHADCPIPFLDSSGQPVRGIVTGRLLEGVNACDIDVRGAYGVEVIFLHNLKNACTNCSEKVKMDADLFAKDGRKRLLGQSGKLMDQDFAFFPR